MATPIAQNFPNVGRKAVAIKASSGTVFSYNIDNPNNQVVYVKFYDKAAASVNHLTDVPVGTVIVQPSTNANNPDTTSLIGGQDSGTFVFATAISARCVTGSLNADSGSPAIGVNIQVDLAAGGSGSGTVTGSGLTLNNVILGGGGAAVQDSGIAVGSFALDSDLPDDLSDLTIGDHTIPRWKLDATAASDLATVTSGGIATLVPGRTYYGDISGALTIAFSPAIATAWAPTLVYAHFTTGVTLTVPTLIRNADTGSTTSVVVNGAQYALLQFSKEGAGNARMIDNILPSSFFGIVHGTFDGQGVAIATGNTLIPYTVPYAGTITGWSISVDQGTATFKVWKKANGTAIPTISDVINTSGVAISTGTHVRSSTVSDFTTTAVAAGDMLVFALTAVAGGTLKAILELEITKSN